MLKKNLSGFLVLLIMFSLAVSSFAQDVSKDKVKNYISELQTKLDQAVKKGEIKRVQTLQNMIEEQKTRLASMKDDAKSSLSENDSSADSGDDLADFKEDVNSSLAELKNSINKVSSDNKDAKVSGVVFFRWQKYTANGGTKVNNFDVERAYLDFKKKLDGGASARVTLDIARLDTTKLDTQKTSQYLFDYLKYAYVEMPLSINPSLQVFPYTATAKIGLQQTVWIDWADKMLDLRYIAKSLVDDNGVMSSSDFGVGALGTLSIGGAPEVEYHATVLNGTGYKAAESNSGKDFGLRLNSKVYSDPLYGDVLLGAFVSSQNAIFAPSGTTSENIYGAMLGLKGEVGVVYGELLSGKKSAKDISGYSIGVKYGLEAFLPGFGVFARADNYDPNTSKSDDQLDKTFYGVTYAWGKDVSLSLDMLNTTGGKSASTSAGKTTSVLSLRTMIKF